MNRLATFLDMEGISKIFPKDELRLYIPFDAVLDAVCRIGVSVYPESPNRLFAHQVGGDGLIIVTEFDNSPEIILSITVLLMQIFLKMGAVAKGGISEGSYGDIQGCFPSLRNYKKVGDRTFSIGRGRLTTFSTMGTALINSHNYASRPPRGCRLAIDRALIKSIPGGVVGYEYESDIIVIDWIHTQTETMEKIKDLAGLSIPETDQLEGMLMNYIERTGELKNTEWGINSLHFNGCC